MLDAVLEFRIDIGGQWLACMPLAQNFEQAAHTLGSVLEYVIDLGKKFGTRQDAGL